MLNSKDAARPGKDQAHAQPKYSIGSALVVRDPEKGATTAEYAITTLAACGFAALLVLILKSDGIQELVTGVISTALGMGQ